MAWVLASVVRVVADTALSADTANGAAARGKECFCMIRKVV